MKKTDLKEVRSFSIAAHNSISHKRKYTNEPYHVHPARVAKLVSSVTTDEEVIAAAWLHDVLEDVAPKNPEFNTDAIRQFFGDKVLQLVLEVTDISSLNDGNREARKSIDRNHLAQASPHGKTIKIADLIDNIIDITEHDPGFAKIFRKEALLNLPFLKEGNKDLYERLKQLLNS